MCALMENKVRKIGSRKLADDCNDSYALFFDDEWIFDDENIAM